jgi:2-oxoglutarate dehydrogenase E2 component (dihydrolipoamide succinyltransferase)
MSTLIDVTVPADQLEGTESVLTRWFVEVGQEVAIHEPLLELTTDKVTVEIAAPAGGVLAEQVKRKDDDVRAGDLVGRIDPAGRAESREPVAASGDTQASGPPEPASPEPLSPADAGAPLGELRLSPAVRKLVREHGLDPSTVAGSGRGGRITFRDVLAHVESATSSTLPAAPATGKTSAGRRVPHSAMRSAIARHMVESALNTAPHVTAVFEADMSRVLSHRTRHRGELEARGIRLTLTSYLVLASVAALRAVPQVNGRWHDDGLELFEDCNVGIATALEPDGLIVPVIHRAQQLDLAGVAARLQDLTGRARSGRLDPREVQNGTFTITNHGVSGSLIATPIINQPQSAILGVGKLQKRLVVVEQDGADSIQIRPMAYVTLTIDHRALDGFQANLFLSHFVETLESAW